MSGVVKVVSGIALVATGIGALAGAGLIGGAGVLGGALASASGGLLAGASVLGLSAGVWSTIGLVAGITAAVGSSVLSRSPPAVKSSPASLDRLNASILPLTGRKTVVGRTAMATDIRDQEFTDNQTYLHRFIVCAAHKVQGFEEIWFDDKLAWTSGGGVQGEFVGYLTVATRTEGSAANAINISGRMGTTRRYTGCAYVHLRFKLTGNSSSVDSPFAQNVPTRVTIVGKGASFYDPRLDSTVSGGSGSHRPNNQATWAWSDTACRNPALALLFYLLGWRINGELSVGLGIPPSRIDFESFITAANLCDENVSLAAGGTEKRYRCDAIWSENDDPTVVLDQLKAAMNADLDDVGGKLRLTVFHNDLGSPVATFGPDNIIGQVQWDQTAALHETFNVVRGTFTDASANSLYQQVDFPQVALASIDGIDRIDGLNLAAVQSASQAQRLAKQRLQRQQYGGILRTVLDVTGWRVLKNDPVTLTLPVFGWTNKLFRVAEIEEGMDGAVPVVLREDHADIYAWDEDESAAVVAAAPTQYDRTLDPTFVAIEAIPGQIPLGGNQIANPFFRAGLSQHQLSSTGVAANGTLTLSSGNAVLASAAPAASGAFASLSPSDGGALLGGIHLFRVYPGQRVAALLKGVVSRADAYATIKFSFRDATLASDLAGSIDGIAFPGHQNRITNSVSDVAVYADVPAGAVWLYLQVIARNSATTAAVSATIEAYSLAYIDPAQSVPPPWSEGPTAEYSATRNVGRGNYASGSTYLPGDMVVWDVGSGGDGNGYIRIGTGATTGTAPSNTSYWQPHVQRGAAGASGTSVAIIDLYRRAAVSPALPSGTFTYTFATATLSGGTLNGWSQAVPAADGNPLWRISAAAVGNTATDSVPAAEFSSPIIDTGAGVNQAIVRLWKRGASAGSDPSGTFTYTFSTGALSGGTLNGWVTVPPAADGSPLWHKQATALSTDATDSIPAAEFSAAAKFVEDGAPGAAGSSVAVVNLFKRGATSPSPPSGTFTYTFATGSLSGGTLNGWSQAVPAANGEPLWRIAAAAIANTPTDSIPAAEFSAAVLDAGAGISTAVVDLWKRGATAGSDPSGTFTYTFATGVLSGGTLNGWSTTPPATDGNPLWHKQAVALSAGATDSIPAAEFSAAAKFVEDGAQGVPGANRFDWIAYAYDSAGAHGFTTGSPGDRAWQGIAVNKATATESTNAADYDWIPYRGPATFGMVAHANVVIGPDYVIKTAGGSSAWNAGAYSSEGYTGGAFVSFVAQSGDHGMMALNTDPALDPDFTSLDFAIYLDGANNVAVSESSTVSPTLTTISGGETLTIHYDGANVRYMKNGSVFRTVPATITTPLYLDCSFFNVNAKLGGIKFGPAGPIGAPGAPGDPGLTSSITPGSPQIPCYVNGTPKAALPNLTMKVFAGDNTNVAGSCSFAVTAPDFSAVNHLGSGVFHPVTMLADNATIEIEATYNGIPTTQSVTFTKQKDAPTYSQKIDNTITAPGSSSYSGTQGGPSTIPVGPDGTITLTALVLYNASTSSVLSGKFRYRPVGGSWTDVAIETVADTAGTSTEPGELNMMETMAGPADAANYEFELMLRISTGSGTITITGASNFAVRFDP